MFSYVLGAISGLTALQGLVFAAECLAGSRTSSSRRSELEDSAAPVSSGPPSSSRRGPRVVVIVPAHNEESVIQKTLENYRNDLWEQDRLIVVADNCTDSTAEIARRCGAEVLVRENQDERGKGYAIHFAVQALRQNPPDVVVVLDADCRVEPGSLAAISRQAFRTGQPVQADNVVVSPPGIELTTKARISAFAFRVRNRVRVRGGDRLGIPSPLTGTGMALPWQVMSEAPSMKDNIVEDLVLGVELALQGTATRYCGEARVTSDMPVGEEASEAQRSRWETGHLATLFSQVPRLILGGVKQKRGELIKMGLDLSIPPLSLLVVTQGFLAFVAGVNFFLGGSAVPLLLAVTGLLAVFVGVRAAWSSEGRELLPPRELLGIPGYALGKLPRYFKFFARGPDRNWVRTKREIAP